MLTFAFRLLGVLCVFSCLSACAPVIAFIGSGNSAIQIAATLDRVKLLGDGVSYLGSGKTITDHAVSIVVGADCHLLNVVSPNPVCKPKREVSADATNARVRIAAMRDDLLHGDTPAPALTRSAAEETAAANAQPLFEDTATDQ
jgi:hypothetical protein